MKRITVLLLAMCICLLSVACAGDSSVPDGMQAAHREGEPFRLYVPEQWKVNEGSGISGAVYFGPKEVVVSARYYTPEEDSLTVEEYLVRCAEGYALTLDSFTMVGIEAAVLGGADAQRLSYTMEIEKEAYVGTQICAKHGGDMVSLQIYMPKEYEEQLAEAVKQITSNFVLCDKAEAEYDEVTDKKTPEGMKIASHDDMEYRLYVPKTWVCDADSDKSEAYYPESGRSNVTVTSYSPDQAMTAAEYWEMCEETYEDQLGGFSLISCEETTVANKDAVSAVYEAEYEGVRFCIRQVSFVYREMVYSLTYTALSDNFALHLADVDRMLSEFHFR